MSLPWITLLLVVPLVGALALAVPALRPHARPFGLGVALVELVVAIVAAVQFDVADAATHQLLETHAWIPAIGVSYAVGLDGLGLTMVLLAVALVPIVLLAEWRLVPDGEGSASRQATYTALVLVLTTFMVGVFAARDVFLFYVIFEAMLIPVYFLIGSFGGAGRRAAAVKFLLYSLAGGLVMLVGVVVLYLQGPRGPQGFLIENLAGVVADPVTERWLFVAFFIAFAIKAPMWPVHTWLPDTAAQATPGTSTLLVGVLDKVGTFGMIALCLPLFPNASVWAAPVIVVLAVISILYGALLAIGQADLMRFVAFTSVSHFGFIVLGIFVGSQLAMTGAQFYMVAHGVSTAALFLLAGFLAERGDSRRIDAYGGLQRVTPVLAGLFLVAGLGSIALPGLAGFIGEYLVLVGSFEVNVAAAIVATLGVVLAAVYFLGVYQRVFTGEPREELRALPDLGARERLAIAPLVVAMLLLGFLPGPVLDLLAPISEVLALGAAR